MSAARPFVSSVSSVSRCPRGSTCACSSCNDGCTRTFHSEVSSVLHFLFLLNSPFRCDLKMNLDRKRLMSILDRRRGHLEYISGYRSCTASINHDLRSLKGPSLKFGASVPSSRSSAKSEALSPSRALERESVTMIRMTVVCLTHF